MRSNASPTPSGIERLAINVSKLLSGPASEICIYSIQIILKKFAKDFRKSTDEKLKERDVKTLRELSASKPDCPHPPFFIVAFQLTCSLVSSKTAL